MTLTMEMLDVLERLEREMEAANRTAEREALGAARAILGQLQGNGLMTIERAAESLGISVSMAEFFVERGALRGTRVGGRLCATRESVQGILDMRKAFDEMESEGTMTLDDILRIRKKIRREQSNVA